MQFFSRNQKKPSSAYQLSASYVCGLIFQGNHFLWDGRITVHMVRNPSICFLLCHWSIPAGCDWSSPRALAHNPWPISQWGVKTLHNLNMHINSQRFVNITELMVDLGPRTQPGLNRCIYPAAHLCFENRSRKICFFLLILSFHISISNIRYVNSSMSMSTNQPANFCKKIDIRVLNYIIQSYLQCELFVGWAVG